MEDDMIQRKKGDGVIKDAANGGIKTMDDSKPTSEFTRATKKQLLLEIEERKNLVLWKHPILTLTGCIAEIAYEAHERYLKIKQHLKLVISLLFFITLFLSLIYIDGPHQKHLVQPIKFAKNAAYWIGLGVLSSIGLGTGLHTFVLFLGPHIAKVSMAASECRTLDFPEPPYPEQILCGPSSDTNVIISTLRIMRKVQLEAFLWGLGTALGELPPYFMAKYAKLTGKEEEDEDLREVAELLKKGENLEEQSWTLWCQLQMKKLIDRFGFFGITLAASIPNPMYDLAGIMCGHFLVPFHVFFGATVLGKAVFKTHLQSFFVIEAFSGSRLESLIDLLGTIPYIGLSSKDYLKKKLVEWKANFDKGAARKAEKIDWIGLGLTIFFWFMIIYFIVSIINAFAQKRHKRLSKTSQEKKQ